MSLTEEITALAKALDIALLDHIIIGDPTWLSLRERGLGFSK